MTVRGRSIASCPCPPIKGGAPGTKACLEAEAPAARRGTTAPSSKLLEGFAAQVPQTRSCRAPLVPQPAKQVEAGNPKDPPASPQTRGRWQKGRSGNPKGRPRTGLALAEAIREKVPPAQIIERAVKILESDDDAAAMTAARFLAEFGFIKPPQQLEIDAALSRVEPVAFDLDRLDAAEQELVLSALRKARLALEAGEGEES
jgi:hypothetical protein